MSERDYPEDHLKALQSGARFFLPKDECHDCGNRGLHYTASGRCCYCARQEAIKIRDRDNYAPWSPAEARDRGLDYYLTDQPCVRAGHIGLKMVSGHCRVCCEPRRKARREGHATYITGLYCSNGHKAERRTRNTTCLECYPNVKSPGVTLPEDTIISREEAKAKGLIHYRTGRACNRGHRGFRYVRNGQCLDCPK